MKLSINNGRLSEISLTLSQVKLEPYLNINIFPNPNSTQLLHPSKSHSFFLSFSLCFTASDYSATLISMPLKKHFHSQSANPLTVTPSFHLHAYAYACACASIHWPHLMSR